MTYDFTVTVPGTYYVHFLVKAVDASEDSLHWGIDTSWLDTRSLDSVYNSWEWKTGNVQTGSLTAAAHTLNVWMREGGMKIDKIVISQSATPPGTVATNVAVGLFASHQHLTHYDGTTFYLFYEKNDANLYWQYSSDNLAARGRRGSS